MKHSNIKKQKEKVGSINSKLTQTKRYKEKIEELVQSMEYVDNNQLKNLKTALGEYLNNPDELGI